MRKIIILTILITSLFLITACEDTQEQETEGAFIGGTQGVTVEFEPFGVEDEGVFSIFDTEAYPIEVTLRNKGEYDLQVGDAVVSLLGPAPTEFAGIASRELKNLQVIDKISELVPDGGEETISFATDAKYSGLVRGVIDRDWLANIEYRYQTYLIIPEVCLKEDLRDDRVCVVKEDKTFFVSGAPITVTSVAEDTSGKAIMALKIKVKNVGGGDKVTKVGSEFGTRDQFSYSIDDPAWECKSGGRVNEAQLREGEAEIICKLINPLQSGDLFTKQVTLTLDYAYRAVVRETIRIKESVS